VVNVGVVCVPAGDFGGDLANDVLGRSARRGRLLKIGKHLHEEDRHDVGRALMVARTALLLDEPF